MTAEQMKEALVAYRKTQGLSQKALADKCNLTQSTISTMEKGEYYPSMYSFLSICEGLEITPSQFFMSEEEADGVFTEKEKMILELWNCLSSKNKELALQIMRYLAQWQEELPEA